MRTRFDSISDLPAVREIRQCGFISGIELKENGDVADPAQGGQLLQTKRASAADGATRRSWATQPVDTTGCPSGAKRVDFAAKVCLAARSHGLLTRPIRNVIVLMPPLCITSAQLATAIEAIRHAIVDVANVAPAKT
jgi:adenosylmethionine-8-amino-7-oxononanoate aminotransferase